MLGVLSNAVMQSLIIALLVFNMVVRYVPVNSYNLYVCAMVIRVTELLMPLWFCCSLWNFKQSVSIVPIVCLLWIVTANTCTYSGLVNVFEVPQGLLGLALDMYCTTMCCVGTVCVVCGSWSC